MQWCVCSMVRRCFFHRLGFRNKNGWTGSRVKKVEEPEYGNVWKAICYLQPISYHKRFCISIIPFLVIRLQIIILIFNKNVKFTFTKCFISNFQIFSHTLLFFHPYFSAGLCLRMTFLANSTNSDLTIFSPYEIMH